MLVTATTDKIEVVLAAAVATNQLHINVSYNASTSTGVTPTKTVTVTNSVTAVTVVPAPASGNQNQLRYCNIFNADSVPATVTVQINYNGTTRKVISVTLQVNEYMQYTYRTGWKVFDMNGLVKNFTNNYAMSEYKTTEHIFTSSMSATFTLGTNTYAYYLGKATGAYTNVMLNYIIIGAATGTTWSELAIYKGIPSLGANSTLTRVGVVDCNGNWAVAGTINRATSIPCNNLVQQGDDLWAVISSSGGTAATFRGFNLPDDIGSGMIQTSSSNRPSTNATLSCTVSTTVTGPFINWQGI